jgi:hypothetical protein
MNKVQKGSEQTGIIKEILNRKPVFIHTTSVEYFCANWISLDVKIENAHPYMQQLLLAFSDTVWLLLQYGTMVNVTIQNTKYLTQISNMLAKK